MGWSDAYFDQSEIDTTDIITHYKNYRQARLRCHMIPLVHYLHISGAKLRNFWIASITRQITKRRS